MYRIPRIVLALAIFGAISSVPLLETGAAVTVPTPGYVGVTNELSSSGCSGATRVDYRLLTVDHAFVIGMEPLSDCSLKVAKGAMGTDPITRTGGAIVGGSYSTSQFAWPGTFTVWSSWQWNPAQGVCPQLVAAGKHTTPIGHQAAVLNTWSSMDGNQCMSVADLRGETGGIVTFYAWEDGRVSCVVDYENARRSCFITSPPESTQDPELGGFEMATEFLWTLGVGETRTHSVWE